MSDLTTQHCQSCEGGIDKLDTSAIEAHLQQLHKNWSTNTAKTHIQRQFSFQNYYQTTAFINGIIWVTHREDHHPDIEFGYNTCTVSYTTHAINGLSLNDFICAAKVDALLVS